jgi:hypothetical protein
MCAVPSMVVLCSLLCPSFPDLLLLLLLLLMLLLLIESTSSSGFNSVVGLVVGDDKARVLLP